MSNPHYQTLRANYIENTRANLKRLEASLPELPPDTERAISPTKQGRLYLIKELKVLISNRLDDLVHAPNEKVFTWTRYVNEIEDLKKQANIQIEHLNDGIYPRNRSMDKDSRPAPRRSRSAEERFGEGGIGVLPTLERPIPSCLPTA